MILQVRDWFHLLGVVFEPHSLAPPDQWPERNGDGDHQRDATDECGPEERPNSRGRISCHHTRGSAHRKQTWLDAVGVRRLLRRRHAERFAWVVADRIART